jgi:hypothetical protein
LPLIEEAKVWRTSTRATVRLSIHPAREAPSGTSGFYVFIVDDIDDAVAELSSRGVGVPGRGHARDIRPRRTVPRCPTDT